MSAYPRTLSPTSHEHLGSHVVPSVEVAFPKWTGAPIADAYGRKPVVSRRIEPMFVELAVASMATAYGWDARWLDELRHDSHDDRPQMMSCWDPRLGRHDQIQDPVSHAPSRAALERIAEQRGSWAGAWSVAAGHEGDVVFYQTVRGRTAPTASQIAWLDAAVAAGMSPDQFVVARWRLH
ncbi:MULTISPECIES: hypothetical protein [unclassified Curtobacterium]|uniref:hypothetical protein n=1 Tax=unclassified Curtobacterium TaxID=257496 RepID=UPI000DA95CCA|nr:MULTISPECIES: hypothetical protein [unclassified Curtobacterium]WIB64537.1 hypothetical protein DEI94_04950 [Curtobacterium sp. MCBD17_040]WIE55564.1 hypothetical protein DEI88_005030 [Curtobacterium sp. MCBD17_003]